MPSSSTHDILRQCIHLYGVQKFTLEKINLKAGASLGQHFLSPRD